MSIGAHELWSFLLIFARTTALFVTAPIFGSRSAPMQAKIGLAALLSLALMPLVAPKVAPAPADLLSLIGQLSAEATVGLCLGFLVMLLMAAFQMAGQFIDTQMGFGIINILNPFSEQQTSALGQFLYQLGMTLFLIMGGHLYVIGTLADSFAVVGPGGARFAGDLTGAMTGIVGQMFALAFKIAAPASIVLLVVDVAFAIIARTVPQMNVFIVGIPAKIIVGLMTVAMALPVVAMLVAQMIPLSGAESQALLRAAK